jgi:uncharacterized protein with HEPN domain
MSKRDELLFLHDMLESVDAILEYTDSLSLDEFSKNRLVYSATIREFEIIGEATIHLSNETLEKHNQIPWRDLKDFRNLLIHEYFGVDSEIVYNTIQNDLPILRSVVVEIINDYKDI